MTLKKISSALVCFTLVTQFVFAQTVVPAADVGSAVGTNLDLSGITVTLRPPGSITVKKPAGLPGTNFGNTYRFNTSGAFDGGSHTFQPLLNGNAWTPTAVPGSFGSTNYFNTDFSHYNLNYSSFKPDTTFGIGSIGSLTKPWWENLPQNFQNNNENGYEFEGLDLSCDFNPDVNIDQLSQIQESNWLNCFEKNVPSENVNIDPTEKLKNDVNACKCLRGSKMAVVLKTMSEGTLTGLKKDRDGEARIEAIVQRSTQVALDQTMNGVIFNISTLSDDPKFIGPYAQNPYKTGTQQSDDPASTKNRSLEFKLNEGILGKYPLPAGTCFSPADFMRTKQLPAPQAKEVLSELASAPFSPEAWDYKKLEDKYFGLMSLPLEERKTKKEELRVLKDKIKFLNFNPLVKYSLSFTDPSLGKDPNAPAAYATKKAELFEKMRSLSSKDCQPPYGQCRLNFNKYLAELLLNNDIKKAVQKEETFDHNRRAKRKANKNLFNPKPNQKDIVAEFKQKFNLGDPHECTPSTDINEAESCLMTYAPYCQMIDRYESEIEAMAPENKFLVDDLDESYEDFVAGSQGEEFKQFNDILCNQKADARKILVRDKTFDEFLVGYCKTPSSHEGCSKKDSVAYAALRKAYFESFDLTTDQKNKLAALGVSPDLFAGMTNGSAGKEISEETRTLVASVSNSDQTMILPPTISSSSSSANVSSNSAVKTDEYTNVDRNAAVSGASSSSSGTTKDAKDELGGFSNNVLTPGSTYLGPAGGTTQVVQQQNTVKEVPNKDNVTELIEDTSQRLAQVTSKPEPQRSEADKQAVSLLQSQLADMQASYAKLTQGVALSEEQNAALQKQLAEMRERQTASVTRKPASVQDLSGVLSDLPTKTITDGSVGTLPGQGVNRNPTAFGAGNLAGGNLGAGNVASPIRTAQLVNVNESAGSGLMLSKFDAGTDNRASGDANGIAVPVTNEVYAEYKKNPQGFDFSKISGAIDPKQLEALKANGEITLLLVNGNQTVEVKVRRDDKGSFVAISKPVMRRALYSQLSAIFGQENR